MSLKSISALFLLISFGVSAQTNHFLLMGGGGEPAGETTIFDHEIGQLKNFLKGNNNWNTTVSFNGGHTKTEGIVSEIVPNNTRFTSERFEALITEYENKLKSGQIKTGDQLLIQIDTHGASKAPIEKSHSVSTAEGEIQDLKTGAGSKLVNLDRLQNLINLAASKNVKLAVLDFSCHSGNALALANPNTCIISSTGPKHFGWAGTQTFSTQFAASMKRGKSLENVFLEAMEKKTDAGFPMISTQVGKSIQDEMYEGLSPFLYSWSPVAHKDKLQAFLEKDVIENQCKELPQFAELMQFVGEAETAVASSNGYKDFRNAVDEYYKFQMKMKEDLNKMNPALVAKQHKICTASTYHMGTAKFTQDRCAYKTTEELLAMDIEQVRATLIEQSKKKTNVIDDAFVLADIENLKKMEVILADIKKQGVDVEGYKNYFKTFQDLEKQSQALAGKVAREASKVYTDLYKKRSESSPSNPCKNFIL